MAQNRYTHELSKVDWLDKVIRGFQLLGSVFAELFYAIRAGTLPWGLCYVTGTLIGLGLMRRWDYWCLERLNLVLLYPIRPSLYWSYCAFVLTSPWWAWSLLQVGLKRKLVNRLTEATTGAGLKNLLGRLPGFIFDRAVDAHTRKLRVTRNNLPLTQFKNARSSLEGGLQIYIDEFRENREAGTVDIIYSHSPMPAQVALGDPTGITANQFVVGNTRSRRVMVSLKDVPHLLVAGQTGGGKSTFLRQLILTLYLRNPGYEFFTVDLKGGLEFQLFEKLPRIKVIPSVESAIKTLEYLETTLKRRMELLKAKGAKDIDSYQQKIKEAQAKGGGAPTDRPLNRQVLIVDEAAEMFLAGHHASSKEIQSARRCLSQIARQGRSLGVHLVLATQRPDARALDPQVKANLTGVLCFQMQNDASSITVLGNGRATDLPPVPGRGIWKAGSEMIEVQTPFVSPEEVERRIVVPQDRTADSQNGKE